MNSPGDPENNEQPLIKSDNLFPVVGIGASAGGLDAFKKLLKAIPEKSGMAYVLVQHLDPNHESMLPEILQKITSIPVLEISDKIKVEPDNIYVIPSNKIMVATDGVLHLAPRPAKSKAERTLPIDLFFTSLAEVHQMHAIGVVLSGTATDGTLGLKAIKDYGGITFAQDEASAAYGGMPGSAVQAGVVDFVLPPEEIPAKILEITKAMLVNGGEHHLLQKDDDVFRQILALLRIRKGNDFTYYKQTTVRRRILRRMALNKNEKPANYLLFLRGNIAEQDALYQDMLIPVTEFFRDTKTFEHLSENVFPQLIKNKTPDQILRIWVAGCSTGEEVYSIAICLKELLGPNHQRVQLFATDISEPAITKARLGIYKKSETGNVSPQRISEFFTKINGSYQVNKQLREMCVFAVHNFLKDPPFGKMDFISCRNVLIYMEPYLQKKALTTFHYALNPNGFLLLGKSETTSCVIDLFAPAAKNDKIFTRKNVPGKYMHVASPRSEQNFGLTDSGSKSDVVRTDFQKTADDILLSKYTPAGVVVNEELDIVYFRGNTGNYLEQSAGKPTHNLLKMARHGLAFELRNILHKAKKEKAPVVKENIPMQINGNLHQISIETIPLTNTIEPHYLILFHDQTLSGIPTPAVLSGTKQTVKTKGDEKDLRIRQMEQELEQIREDMRSITEDQEAANEELQSANEELLSGSEELQSLNEELETNKEELQSTNEELTIVNHEIISLNEILTDARDYAEAIRATIHEPMLILDTNFRVSSANPSFYKYFGVKEDETEGMILFDLGNGQWDIPALHELLDNIIARNANFQDFEFKHKFPVIGEKILLLNASRIIQKSGQEQRILLAIEDITSQKIIEKELTEAKVYAEMSAMLAEEAKNKAEISEQMAKDAVVAKQQFLSNMSHEIRTPMNAIIGFTRALLKSELSAQQMEFLNAIKISGDTLIVLINDILDLAKVDAGKMKFEQLAFNLKNAQGSIFKLFETKIGDKNLELINEYDTTIPETLVGDEVRLNQILMNLISNAVKFTDKGKITLSIRKLKEENNLVRVEFAVKDTGIGIPQGDLEKIFENFQQASSDTSRLYGGTGLGLAIVKQLVEQQGGTVSVKSKVNKGSVFSFILPFEKSARSAVPDQSRAEQRLDNPEIKILVVEDMALNRLLMKTILDDFGFEKDMAENGKVALELLSTNNYDLILMDLQMPEMNGFETTEFIRNVLKSNIPIIALTADVTTVDVAKCKAAGMNDYITKPVDEKILYNKIAEMLSVPLVARGAVALPEIYPEDGVINLEYIKERTKSDPKKMIELISVYLDHTPPVILALGQSLREKDWQSLASAVHKIVPSIPIMGMGDKYVEMAKKVQEYAGAKQNLDQIPGLVLQLEHVFDRAGKELEEELRKLKMMV